MPTNWEESWVAGVSLNSPSTAVYYEHCPIASFRDADFVGVDSGSITIVMTCAAFVGNLGFVILSVLAL